MAYVSRELIDVQNPTKGKIYITLSNSYDILLHGAPSYGEKNEDGKCYDYGKEVVTALTLKECLQIMNFCKGERLSNSVSLVREVRKNAGNYSNKKISFDGIADKKDPTKLGYFVIKFKENSMRNGEVKDVSFDIPINKEELVGVELVLRSYLNNYALIKYDYIKNSFNDINYNKQAPQTKFKEEESQPLF